jgi:hypothetical protein
MDFIGFSSAREGGMAISREDREPGRARPREVAGLINRMREAWLLRNVPKIARNPRLPGNLPRLAGLRK